VSEKGKEERDLHSVITR